MSMYLFSKYTHMAYYTIDFTLLLKNTDFFKASTIKIDNNYKIISYVSIPFLFPIPAIFSAHTLL